MEEKNFTTEQVIILIKAFHLDSVQGRYNKELLNWCNNWIDYNVKEKINFEEYSKNLKQN